jgi:cyclophilin family peptidyl-prolyl cis-trans isomerase
MKFRAVAVAILFFASLSLQAGVLARFDMKKLGIIDVELFEQDKPVTVSNFVAYVKSGAWHDNIMHRWVTNFVIQGGSWTIPFSPTNSPLSVDPTQIATFPAITNEYSVGRTFSNVYGTIAMARVAGQTNSATSSWFFNVRDNAFLDNVDGGFTAFGRTLRGTNILNRFVPPPGVSNIYFLNDFTTPVYSENGVTGFWLNVDVTLLTAQIRRVGEMNEISWNSVEGLPNVVEFTNVLPPVWQTVLTLTGTGAQLTVSDNPGTDKFRHYRVRVVYPQ